MAHITLTIYLTRNINVTVSCWKIRSVAIVSKGRDRSGRRHRRRQVGVAMEEAWDMKLLLENLLLKLKLLAELPPKLLSIPGLVILEPIEHILPFNLTIQSELCSNLLNLRRARGPYTRLVHLLQYHQLVRSRAPPWWSRWTH